MAQQESSGIIPRPCDVRPDVSSALGLHISCIVLFSVVSRRDTLELPTWKSGSLLVVSDGVGHTLKPLQQTFIIAKMTAIGTATCPLKKCQFIKDSCKNKIRSKREVACVLCVLSLKFQPSEAVTLQTIAAGIHISNEKHPFESSRARLFIYTKCGED